MMARHNPFLLKESSYRRLIERQGDENRMAKRVAWHDASMRQFAQVVNSEAETKGCGIISATTARNIHGHIQKC